MRTPRGDRTRYFHYYESMKRKLLKPVYECRYDVEHLKIETRLIDEKFASVMGECVI